MMRSTLIQALKNVAFNESGSTLTEFIIGLPIFLLIFSGLGSLYQINQAKLNTLTKSNHSLWVESQETSLALTPAAAGISAIGNAIGGNGSLIGNLGNASQAGGIYFDSYIKTVASQIIPGAPGIDPKINIKKISGLVDGSPARLLLDDRIRFQKPRLDGSIFGKLSGLISATGSGLGIAAGIRYGEAATEGESSSVSTSFGTYSIPATRLSVPLNTAATSRLIGVGLTRLEHAREPVLRKTILDFNTKKYTKGPPKWAKEARNKPDPREQECLEERQEQAAEYSECLREERQRLEDEQSNSTNGGSGFTQGDVEAACESEKPDTGPCK